MLINITLYSFWSNLPINSQNGIWNGCCQMRNKNWTPSLCIPLMGLDIFKYRYRNNIRDEWHHSWKKDKQSSARTSVRPVAAGQAYWCWGWLTAGPTRLLLGMVLKWSAVAPSSFNWTHWRSCGSSGWMSATKMSIRKIRWASSTRIPNVWFTLYKFYSLIRSIQVTVHDVKSIDN